MTLDMMLPVSPVILDDVPQVMLTVIKQQPDFTVCVGKKHLRIVSFIQVQHSVKLPSGG